jgi:serine/threonine protein kinase
MTKLRHPNIIQFYALSIHDGALVLVMELMSSSFRDLLNDDPKELTLAIKGKILHGTGQTSSKGGERDLPCLLSSFHESPHLLISSSPHLLISSSPHLLISSSTCILSALGLRYLHSRSPMVIHRDLKSMNILVDKGMNAKLTDFGISRAKQSAEQALTSFSGTVAWMAPELLR